MSRPGSVQGMHARRVRLANVQQYVPSCLKWTRDEVAEWVEELGFARYKAAFHDNYINGRRLVMLDMQTLPKIGITDYEHMKIIAPAVREILGIEKPDMDRPIVLPRRHPLEIFLEQKTFTGMRINHLTFEDFLIENPMLFDEFCRAENIKLDI